MLLFAAAVVFLIFGIAKLKEFSKKPKIRKLSTNDEHIVVKVQMKWKDNGRIAKP